jgi:hyperosmotically inducible periplasmic protein
MKSVKIGLAIALVVAASAVAAGADSKDAWLTTKAKIALLTTEGVSVTAVNVDTVNGKITMHGKVGTAAEKTKAGETIQALDGVKSVNNLLQVVPQDQKKMVDLKDSVVKDRVEASLKAAKTMDGIQVASVNKGVVLLSGKSPSLDQKLLVIERVYTVDGVQRVATEIVVQNP